MNNRRLMRSAALILVLMGGMLASQSANAWGGYYRGGPYWHGGWGVGVYVGGPIWPYYSPYYPYYPYSPLYYGSPGYVEVPAEPSTYVERGDGVAPAAPPHYWYYCGSPQGYYPYVKSCPGGWQQVVPQPPSAPQ